MPLEVVDIVRIEVDDGLQAIEIELILGRFHQAVGVPDPPNEAFGLSGLVEVRLNWRSAMTSLEMSLVRADIPTAAHRKGFAAAMVKKLADR